MEITIVDAKDPPARELCLRIRHRVFVEEQGVPAALEADGKDAEASHFLALLDGQPAGAGRLRVQGRYAKLERIATLAEHRGLGIGRRITEAMRDRALRAHPGSIPFLHAQGSAVGFYRKLGWVMEGPVFHEAGIPHQAMVFPAAE
jgi:predicted GNAT family N-acyltransferase